MGNRLWSRIDAGFTKFVAAWNPYDPAQLEPSDLMPVVVEESEIKKNTLRLVFVFLTVFLVWSVTAPLDSGVNVPGTVVVQGNRKAVQHPTGGVVTEMLVKEGAHVKAGQVLLKVNPLNTEANLNQSELDFLSAMAIESRLLSERTGAADIRWIPELLEIAPSDPRIAQLQALQRQIFLSRRQEFQTQQNILTEQATSLEKQMIEVREVLKLKKGQLVSIEEEAKNNKELAAKGFVSVSRANEVDRQLSDLLANISNSTSEITRTQQQLTATRLQQLQAKSTFIKEVDTQLAEVQKNRRALKTRVDSLQFDRDLAEVRAPVDGVVVGLKINTVGGVIQASSLLMEVVPEGGNLIVEGRVPPQSIDKVRVGLKSDLRFTAFNLNSTPVVEGEVKLVGADKVAGQTVADDYYLAQIETTAEGLKTLGTLQVQPGMPVEVIVKTGERSFMSYMFKPLSDRVARSFKE